MSFNLVSVNFNPIKIDTNKHLLPLFSALSKLKGQFKFQSLAGGGRGRPKVGREFACFA